MPPKKFLRNKALFVFLASILTAPCSANAERKYSVRDHILSVTDNIQTHSCALNIQPLYAVESYDGDAVILSDRDYIKRSDLYSCNGSKIKSLTIPRDVGFLSDININNNIYVSLDFVMTRPNQYLATVAKLQSSVNLVSIKGAYKNGAPLNSLKKYAFTTSGEAGASIISVDGKYVAPDGVADCGRSAHPGVWDIANNKRIITDRDSCIKLFQKK